MKLIFYLPSLEYFGICNPEGFFSGWSFFGVLSKLNPIIEYLTGAAAAFFTEGLGVGSCCDRSPLNKQQYDHKISDQQMRMK